MSVNSISPNQTVQRSQMIKSSEATASRKQADIKESYKANDRKDAAERQAQIQSQQQKVQEPSKPVVNSMGQQTGTRINTSA